MLARLSMMVTGQSELRGDAVGCVLGRDPDRQPGHAHLGRHVGDMAGAGRVLIGGEQLMTWPQWFATMCGSA